MITWHRLLLHLKVPLYLVFLTGGIYLGLYLGTNEVGNTKDDEKWWTTFLRALNLICIFHMIPVAIGFLIPHKKTINCIQMLKDNNNGNIPTLYIRYVTRGDNINVISTSVNATLKIIEGYENILIEVVTDNDILPDNLKNLYNVSELTVPHEYETENDTIFKARALQYALENSPAKPDDYILHMDEESHLTERALMGIYQHIYQKPDHIGQGMITYRRSLYTGWRNWKNTICTLADTIRISDDLSRFRLSFILGNPIFGCKGSYLLMKTSIEKNVTMNMLSVLCITEDASFAFSAYQQKVKFAFVEGELIEISPSNFTDFIKQRARWIKGLWLIVLHHECSIWRRIIIAIDIIAWALMFLNIIAFVSFFVLTEFAMPVTLAGINGFIFASYIFSYIYGGLIGGYGWISLISFILMPIFLLLETAGALYGFMTVKNRDFYVIKK